MSVTEDKVEYRILEKNNILNIKLVTTEVFESKLG
jgi:hypothetical protein